MRERGWEYRRRWPEGTVLYEVVRGNLATLLAEADELGRGLPRYVERDFAKYLECGVLAHGFARVRCESCKDADTALRDANRVYGAGVTADLSEAQRCFSVALAHLKRRDYTAVSQAAEQVRQEVRKAMNAARAEAARLERNRSDSSPGRPSLGSSSGRSGFGKSRLRHICCSQRVSISSTSLPCPPHQVCGEEPFMSRTCLFLSMLILGCVDPEPLGEPASDVRLPVVAEESEMDLALAPSEYHCEVMTEAARTAVPPPPPVFERASVAPRVRAVCPPGHVPFYRQTEIRTHKVGPPLRPEPNGTAGSATSQLVAGAYWYAGVMKPTEWWNQNGVGASILIANPAVYDQSDMVTAQMSTVRGANYHLVEIGLRKFWDAFPRLMISQWSYGQFNDAAGFVRVHGVYAPGMPLSNYYGYAVQHYIRYDNGNWWIWFNDGWVGYFPGSLWNGQFTSGDMAHFYGEVYSAQSRVPPLTDMGTGQFSWSGGSAYMQEMCMHSASHICYYLTDGWRSETNAAYYSLSYWNGSYMQFGGNGGG